MVIRLGNPKIVDFEDARQLDKFVIDKTWPIFALLQLEVLEAIPVVLHEALFDIVLLRKLFSWNVTELNIVKPYVLILHFVTVDIFYCEVCIAVEFLSDVSLRIFNYYRHF